MDINERTKYHTQKTQYSKKGNPNWKGGKMIADGYIYLYNPHHPFATKLSYVCEHRLVMEKYLGRFLNKREIVHHKNKVRTDNRIENLELSSSTGRHYIDFHLKRDKKNGKFKK